MHPFRAGKLLAQARRLGADGVARAVLLLADADLSLRGMTAWPDELILEVLVARLARLAPRPPPSSPGAKTRRR
jgi:DNA polymerase III delta subunit